MTSKQTIRGLGNFSVNDVGAADLTHLRQLACPFALGGPQELLEKQKFFWETLISFGVTPLLLAIVGVCLRGRDYPMPRYVALLLLALLFALGPATPFYEFLHEFIPGISKFRIPTRIMFIASAAVAVLAAGGTDGLLSTLGHRHSVSVVFVTGAIGAVVIAELSASSDLT